MPTGILQDKHLSRILSTMRQEERRIEELYFNERLRRERRRLHESKHRKELTAQPGPGGKMPPSPLKPPSSSTGEKKPSPLLEQSLSKTHPPTDTKAKAQPSRPQFQKLLELKQNIKKGNDRSTGGLITLAIKQALLDEGIHLSSLPHIKIDLSQAGEAQYSPGKNTITINCSMPTSIPYTPELSVAAAREKIRFAIAEFTSSLIHEMRHFEQYMKSYIYEKIAPPYRPKLPPDFKKWFIEHSDDAMESDETDEALDTTLFYSLMQERQMLMETPSDSKKQTKKPQPLAYDDWKKATQVSDGLTRDTVLSMAYVNDRKKKFREKYSDIAAETMMKGKPLAELKNYAPYIHTPSRRQKWVEQKMKKAYEAYKDNFEKLSKVKGTNRKRATDLLFHTKVVQSRRMLYLNRPKEMDAHTVQFTLLRRYLPGDQFMKFLQARDEFDKYDYNWIRKQIAQKDSKDKTLPPLEV